MRKHSGTNVAGLADNRNYLLHRTQGRSTDFKRRYWDWSLDATPSDPSSTDIYSTPIFDPVAGFGGNGDFVEHTPEKNPLNITGGTGGGCVQDGPFVPSNFTVNYPKPDCLRRDFIPHIMNTFADPKLVEKVLSQPDYTSFARAIENVPSFDQPNIHGSGHFGVGGVLGTIGNASQSPGGTFTSLSIHHTIPYESNHLCKC